MLINNPRVTIGLPVYNGESFIARAIDSILGQSFRDIELIIMDNCSTDGTEEICRRYVADDPRVRYFRHDQNIGVISNFNSVVPHARGEYFKWAASDDICETTLVERLVEALDNRPEAVIAFSQAAIFDECPANGFGRLSQSEFSENGIVRIEYPADLFSRNPMERFRAILQSEHPGTMIYGLIRNDALQKSHLHQVEGSEYLLVDDLLFYRRIHDDNVDRSRREYMAMVHGSDRPGILMPPWRWPLNYMKTIAESDQSKLIKLKAITTVIRHTFRLRFLRNFLVPGPENYWGITRGKLRIVYIL